MTPVLGPDVIENVTTTLANGLLFCVFLTVAVTVCVVHATFVAVAGVTVRPLTFGP